MTKLNRQFIKLMVFITFLVIIPSACLAFDDNSTNLNQNIISDTQTDIYVSLSGNNNNNGTLEHPKLTLDGDKGAIAYATSKNISSIILGNGTFDISQIIEINKNNYNLSKLTIKGSGSTILSAIDTSIFKIGLNDINSKPMDITLINIAFTKSSDMNPAISIYHSYVNLFNCSFYENEAYFTASCVGVYYNSTVKITNSTFYNNKNEVGMGVIESECAGYDGSTILLNNLFVEKCKFIDNDALAGSAIYIDVDGPINTITAVKDSIFINNHAEEGGAIYNVAPTIETVKGESALVIDNCTFENNTAENAGGAIYNGGDVVLSIKNSKFYNNSVSSSLSIANYGVGGALFAGSGSTQIVGSEFIDNGASKGGAIFNTMMNDIQIYDTLFKTNDALMGGAVYMDLPYDYGSYSVFDNITFDSNTAEIGDALFTNDLNEDGGKYLYFTCYNSKFINNTVYNVGNFGIVNNTFVNSTLYNTGSIKTLNNTYNNSDIEEFLEKLNIKFLNNVSGYLGDVVRIQANASDIFSDNIIVFNIGLKEYLATYNKTTGLFEYDYKIGDGSDVPVTGYSLLTNDYDSNKVYIKVLKLPVNLTVEAKDINVGENLNVSVTLSSNNTLLNANVVVLINNKEYNVYVKNGQGNISVSNAPLKLGVNDISATYGKNSFKYEYTIVNSTFNVVDSKIVIIDDLVGTIITVGNVSGYYNTTAILFANITKDGKVAFYTGQLEFLVNNQIIKSNFNYNNNRYEADYKINQTTKTKISINNTGSAIVNEGILNILKHSTNLKLNISDITVNKSPLVINVTLKSGGKGIDGVVKVNIGGKVYEINVVKGLGSINVNNLPVGNYTAIAKYDGSSIYNSTNVTAEFKVLIDQRAVNILSQNIELYYHNGTRFYITLVDCYSRPITNANVIFHINGVPNYRTTDSDGKASITIDLAAKNYTMVTEFKGNDKYDPLSVSNNVTVLSTISGKDIIKIYKNGTQYYAKFVDGHGNPLVGFKVAFNINGVFYYKVTDSKGIASLSIYLFPKTYILTAINYYNGDKASNFITVLSSVEGPNLVKYYRNDSQYVAKYIRGDGSPIVGATVSFNINGVFYYKVTNTKGEAQLNIYLNPGQYIITTINPESGQSYSNIITVLSVIKSDNLVLTYRDGSKFTVVTLDGHGKPLSGASIRFNINGVFYYRVSDDNGMASLTIELNPGQYIITTTWYELSVSNTITVYRRV